MKAARILKAKINSAAITTGALVTFHLWPGIVELLKKAGLDFMIIDQEHGAFNDQLAAEVCATGRLVDFPVLIRVIDANYSTIRSAIDRGPCGLMIPSVESVEALDQVRESIFMPPRGKRRPGGPGNAWLESFNYPDWKAGVEDHFIVLPQIETKAGLACAEALAAHEITTAIAVGPYDLSADLGVCWNPAHPRHKQAIATIRQAARKAGKQMLNIGSGPDLVKQGFTFVCIAEPTIMMQQALAAANLETRRAGRAKRGRRKPIYA